jgi:hypothetical protein
MLPELRSMANGSIPMPTVGRLDLRSRPGVFRGFDQGSAALVHRAPTIVAPAAKTGLAARQSRQMQNNARKSVNDTTLAIQ